MTSTQSETPWYAAYPVARNQNPHSILREELLELFKQGKETGKDFALVDLRRTDFEVQFADPSLTSKCSDVCLSVDLLMHLFVRVAQFVDLSTFLLKACIRQFQRFIHYSTLLACLELFGIVVCLPPLEFTLNVSSRTYIT